VKEKKEGEVVNEPIHFSLSSDLVQEGKKEKAPLREKKKREGESSSDSQSAAEKKSLQKKGRKFPSTLTTAGREKGPREPGRGKAEGTLSHQYPKKSPLWLEKKRHTWQADLGRKGKALLSPTFAREKRIVLTGTGKRGKGRGQRGAGLLLTFALEGKKERGGSTSTFREKNTERGGKEEREKKKETSRYRRFPPASSREERFHDCDRRKGRGGVSSLNRRRGGGGKKLSGESWGKKGGRGSILGFIRSPALRCEKEGKKKGKAEAFSPDRNKKGKKRRCNSIRSCPLAEEEKRRRQSSSGKKRGKRGGLSRVVRDLVSIFKTQGKGKKEKGKRKDLAASKSKKKGGRRTITFPFPTIVRREEGRRGRRERESRAAPGREKKRERTTSFYYLRAACGEVEGEKPACLHEEGFVC